ncbi:kex protein [Heliocybe sulcata]|uniref:Kex protein n=1 Tax=Heliocybe sulcata TaxID=5364 RepID=A0A5C3NA89_9AGAM|nr:kex protein [Heliocybe sulcata]
MRLPLPLVLLLLLPPCALSSGMAKRSYSTHDYYVLEHRPLGHASLDECVSRLGLEVIEQVGELDNHWLVRRRKAARDVSARTTADPVVELLQSLRQQVQRGSTHARSEDLAVAWRVSSSIKYLEPQAPRQRVKRAPPPVRPGDGDVKSNAREVASRLGIQDPTFTKQWHLVNDENPEHMMNVSGLWEEGITGSGVISALVDDGLDYNSDDLAANFFAEGSYDFNDHEDLPTPKLFDDHHGTRCAGQIGAVKNDVCGVGIAYDSKVAGIRILSGPISDVDEAASLNYGYHNTSIYSCSWGPADDGRSMEAPGYLIEKAVLNGIQNGRGGKGSVYVFASGNGAQHDDQCNFDGYTNSIYSITVAAVDFKGLHPYYSEACAANMVVAYSSGSGNNIVTTDVGKNKCATTHGGTSAAAPNAVGVFALALSVRPELTWRDLQHLCVKTAEMINPEDPDWETTAAGRPFSYKYGFGRLDGYSYVKAAQAWEPIKPQAWLEIQPVQIENGTMDILGTMSGGAPITTDGVKNIITITQDMLAQNNLEKLEHITIRVWISHTRRGDVEVELVSPNGIKSVLAARRRYDATNTGFPGWRFMTVKHWDENPVGDWTIRVNDQGSEGEFGNFLGWTMTLWGSTIDASKAKLYEVPVVENLLPPPHEDAVTTTTTPVVATATTKSYAKPTSHLPTDHGSVEGEATKPAFTNKPGGATPTAQDDAAEATETIPSESITPTPDEGWFPDMDNLVSNQKWFFGAVGAVAVFGLSAGIFFWRRAVNRRRRAQYSTLSMGDDVPMSSVARDRGVSGQGTKELYDAFGEVSDDDDVDEETGLTGGRPQDRSPGGLGFHSGFLDDDDPQSARATQTSYRDEPEDNDRLRSHSTSSSRVESPSSSGTGDGSWEHASQQLR